jgi:hypothetical protein
VETDSENGPIEPKSGADLIPETTLFPANHRRYRAYFRASDMSVRDGTGWLGREDSNWQMSFPKMGFEMLPEFPLILERLGTRDYRL